MSGCLASLEYAEPPGAAPAPAEETADAGEPVDAAPEETAGAAPVELDPAVLAEVEQKLRAAGLTPQRRGRHGLSAELAVYFDFDSGELRPESRPALEAVLQLLADAPRVTAVRIAAHSDGRGSAAYNLRLTAVRALAVAAWLVEHGVPCERLEAVGYGEGRPIAGNITAGGFARNRRVELVIVGVDGQTWPADGGGYVAGSPCDGAVRLEDLPDPEQTPPRVPR